MNRSAGGRRSEGAVLSEEEGQYEAARVSKTWIRNLATSMRRESREQLSITRGGRVDGDGRRSSTRHRLVIHPLNLWYVAWKHFILLWAVYSSFFTPLEFGFFRGLPEDLFLLDIAGQFAFLIDILVRFSVAYRDTDSDRMVYDRNLIAFRYLKSRFLVDLLACFPWDAIYKASGRQELVRYLLWIRLSRALRVTEFFAKLEKDIRINYHGTRTVKLFVVELYCTHTAACIFYYLATTVAPSKEGYTWIGSLEMGDFRYSDFRKIDLWKRYVTSLYFSIVTMTTVGYGDIIAVNAREMIFVMIYVSFNMILGAYLLGNIAALIVKGSKTEKFRDKMADLIKYMNKNNLDRHISNEIKGHLRLQYDRSTTEVALLQDLPTPIQIKISQNLFEPYVKEASLFKGCSLGFIKQIASRVHEEFFIPGEVIIEQGNIIDQLYIICHGEVEEVGNVEDDETEECLARQQAYGSFGEVSFLCNIPQTRTVRVCELCRVLRLDKRCFTEILEICFSDGQIILKNLLEGKDPNLQSKILESNITLYIELHESELAVRVNCAAYDGDSYRLKRLIRAGANPNKADYDGRSPLHIVASKGYKDIARFLIEQGVGINISDHFGNTPLLEAIKNGHDQVASLLVKAGATLVVDDAGGFLCTTVVRRDVDLLKKVLSSGINPNATNYDRRTPLHIAASEGLYSMVELLLEAGAIVLSKDRWGNTPLDDASIGGNKDLIKLLKVAATSQLSELSNRSQEIQDEIRQKKCRVFPFHPWDPKEERREGIVLWVPKSIQDLIQAAREQLKCSSGSCILSEDGAKILDINIITNDQKLYLVSESKEGQLDRCLD